eukprot:737-Heterococcus_DN1.PRE.2
MVLPYCTASKQLRATMCYHKCCSGSEVHAAAIAVYSLSHFDTNTLTAHHALVCFCAAAFRTYTNAS